MSNPSNDPLRQGDLAAFWRHKSLDELIAEQGIQPIEDFQRLLDEVGDLWPEDESVDDFLAWLRQTRREREGDGWPRS